jgi:hypothetical protein
MTPAKLRALISLYHQADTFITPENLSQRIDEAFIPPNQYVGTTPVQQGPDFITVKRLEDELERQRMEPKVMEPDTERKGSPSNTHGQGGGWSERMDAREEKVLEALYGVERGRNGQMLPGLDLLMEERERLGKDREAIEQGRLEESQGPNDF